MVWLFRDLEIVGVWESQVGDTFEDIRYRILGLEPVSNICGIGGFIVECIPVRWVTPTAVILVVVDVY